MLKNHTLISLGRENPSSKEGMLWLFEFGFITNLKWDLGEWFWGGQGTKILVPSTNIFLTSKIDPSQGMKGQS
jgi:hypothetical protein